jgi:hypothetical protein
VTIVRYCVVTLPGALLLRGDDVNDPLALHALERAVRGIASSPPPAATGSPAGTGAAPVDADPAGVNKAKEF